ncbi:MAG: serine/threonine protein kinase [Acidobacteriaceae bacterium]|nr:serine/threonine protein kinase [Acidobacteriaceae bacterium]
MALAPGTKLGPYEIVSPLGAGGMGEVYRARDQNLGRDVAIKVLPKELVSDRDRLRRFEQEARATAALNHPNILAIYQFGTTEEDAPYLVTELLQGQTLRERLNQGEIPVRKVMEFGLQTARGLAAAHDRSIVHRDLKPENLFLTRDGVVKILDFGLAKLVGSDAGGPRSSVATASITELGMVLGTVGYMSPEQVRGLAVDHRSDIFSLGAILYEMLSGNRAFHGKTAADTMSAILKEEPAELSGTERNLHPAVGRIVHRCLEKDPTERFQSARDLAFNLEFVGREESRSRPAIALPAGNGRRWLRAALAALAVLVSVGLGLLAQRGLRLRTENSPPVELMRLTDFMGMEEFPALSPDGKSVAFTANVGGRRQVWMRLLAGGSPLQVTHNDADHQYPRWSPDSSSLIYFSPSTEPDGEGKIWQIPALGGTARPLVSSLGGADLSHDGKHIAYFHSNQGKLELAVADPDGSNSRNLAGLPTEYNYSDLRWSPDDRKLGFQRGRTFDYDVFYVPAEGGSAQAITQDRNPLAGFAWLPDGSGVVYSSSRGDTVLYLRTMNLWSVETGGKNLRQLTFGETSYISPDLDRHGNLVATRRQIQFDIWRFPVDGRPEENVRSGVQITRQTGTVQTPSVSPGDHELVYLSDSGGHGNLWVLNLETQQNREVTFEHDPQVTIGVPVWSPDGKHIAYVKRGLNGWNVDLWLMNPDGSDAHKISDGGGWACWSPDSQWIYFSPPSQNGFRIEKASPAGGPNLLVREEGQKPAVDAGGKLYFALSLPALNGLSDMQILVASPENGSAHELARISGSRLSSWLLMQPVVSPDGKWLAVMLTDGPTTDLWAQPTTGGPMRRITDFGRQATFITRRVSWSSDGHSIYAAVGNGEADIVQLKNLERSQATEN